MRLKGPGGFSTQTQVGGLCAWPWSLLTFFFLIPPPPCGCCGYLVPASSQCQLPHTHQRMGAPCSSNPACPKPNSPLTPNLNFFWEILFLVSGSIFSPVTQAQNMSLILGFPLSYVQWVTAKSQKNFLPPAPLFLSVKYMPNTKFTFLAIYKHIVQ